jgi:phospholipid/cholesterol/gamma-HCH transport system substrate-binding protein
MENRAHALSAGLFLVLLSIGLVMAAVRLTGGRTEHVDYVIESRYPVSGLQQNAPVRLRGVDIGKVGTIQFASDDSQLILVRIAVDPKSPITTSTYARLGYLGITGLSYVHLDSDGGQPEKLASTPDKPAHIVMRPSLLDQLGSSGEELMQDTAVAAKRVNELLSEENLSELSEAIANINTASGNIARLTGDLRPAMKALAAIPARTDRTLQRLEPLLGNLDLLTQDVRSRLEALDRIGQSAEDLGQTSRAVDAAIPRLNSVLDDFSRSLRTVDRVLMGIEQQPQSLLFGRRPPPPGPGENGFGAPASPP